MNYEKFSIITCEFMAAKVLILLLCATTVVVQLCLADEDTPGVLDGTSVEVKFTKEPEDAIVAPGQNATLSCQVSVNGADKQTYYQWKFNNEIVRRFKTSGTYTVPVKKLKSGEGKYYCIANTTYGLLRSRSAHLQIAEISLPPAEKLGPLVINATEGENVRLTCDLISIPEVEITWKFRNQHIPKKTEKYLISSKYLYINNVQKFDAGEYSCEGRNRLVSDGLTILSLSLFVTSSSPSQLEFISPKLPPNMIVQRGKNLSLHCHANKADADVRWAEIYEVDRGGVSSIDTRAEKSHFTLDFGEIKENEYKYSCVAKAKNAKGEQKKVSQVVDIKVGDGPKITSISFSRKSIRMGIPVRFHCNVTGYPMPSVKWYHNGEEVVPNRDHRITLKSTWLSSTTMSYGLVINSIASADKGVYQCVAENEFGSTSRATVLEIALQGYVPSKVIDVKCTPLSTTEIMITFNYTNDPDAPLLQYKEDDNSPFNQDDKADANAQVRHVSDVFLVTYHREDNVTDQHTETTINGSALISKCRPDTKYVFFVKRYNGHQGSEPSDRVVCSTIGDTTLKLKYDRIYLDTVLISWKELDQQTYTIEAKANETEVFSSTTNNSFVIINNLNLNVEYEVKVSSSKGNNFEPIKFTLGPEENKCVFQFYKINESSVVFIWSLINLDVDFLDGFVISYKKHNLEDTVRESFLGSKATSFIAHGLSPGQSYEASLFVTISKAKALVGRTAFTMEMQTPTPTLLPSSYTSCDSAQPHKPSRITFMWFYPWEITGPMFLVKLQKHDSDDEPQLRVVASEDEKFYIFDDLLENTKYDISVRVFSRNGESSNYTAPRICPTGRSQVGGVTEITWTQLDPNTVSLSWKKPNVTFDENTDSYIVIIHERSYNPREIKVPGNVTSTVIPNLKTDTDYEFIIRTKGLPNEKGVDSPQIPIKLKQPEPESNETLIGLIIGGSISLASILLCIISAFYGKKFLKKYYLERNDSMRAMSNGKKQEKNILARNSTVFQNSTIYSNGATLQSPLLRNGGCVIGRPQVHSIDGVRYCPGAGIRTIRYENDNLLNCDSPMDESFHSFMDLPDKERDNEGGDSGYCDKNLSQSPPLKDCNAKRVRKFSDGATDEGFHDSNGICMNGSSSSPV